MSFPTLPRHLLAERVHFSFEDRARIARCRRDYNRLGFAYQMAFLRLLGRFPRHQPIEILEDLLAYVAQRLDLNRAQQILLPAASTLRRLVIEERAAYRRRLFRRMMVLLPAPVCEKLDELLLAGDEATSRLQVLKEPPGAASPRALLKESAKLKLIEEASILEVDLSWIRSSLRKAMARRIRYSDAHRAYELRAPHRYTALACFLHETHAETARTLVEMHAKLMTQTFRRAQNRLNEKLRANRKALMGTLESFRTVTRLVLSGEVSDLDLRAAVLCSIPAERLEQQLADAEEWLTGSRSDVFPLVRQRFSYLRQFSPNGKLDDFFMPDDEWDALREPFFACAGLPADPDVAVQYLKRRLGEAYDRFLWACRRTCTWRCPRRARGASALTQPSSQRTRSSKISACSLHGWKIRSGASACRIS